MKRVCSHCGRKRPAADLLFSRHTGQRYCSTDMARCELLGARRVKRAKEVSA